MWRLTVVGLVKPRRLWHGPLLVRVRGRGRELGLVFRRKLIRERERRWRGRQLISSQHAKLRRNGQLVRPTESGSSALRIEAVLREAALVAVDAQVRAVGLMRPLHVSAPSVVSGEAERQPSSLPRTRRQRCQDCESGIHGWGAHWVLPWSSHCAFEGARSHS